MTGQHLPLQGHAPLHHLIQHVDAQHKAGNGQGGRNVGADVQVLDEGRQIVCLLQVLRLGQPVDRLLQPSNTIRTASLPCEHQHEEADILSLTRCHCRPFIAVSPSSCEVPVGTENSLMLQNRFKLRQVHAASEENPGKAAPANPEPEQDLG